MAKTKALISFAVTAKLICDFVFAYANIRFSHAAAHIIQYSDNRQICTVDRFVHSVVLGMWCIKHTM